MADAKLTDLIEEQADNFACGLQDRNFLRNDDGSETLGREMIRLNLEQFAKRLAASTPAREEAPAEGAGDDAEDWRERALSAEASMLALRRIEDAKVFCEIETSDIWSVHVRGPDETVAAKSYADAVSYCDKLNAECPDARAVPVLSPHKGDPVVLSAYDVACYEYPYATGAPLRDAFALGAMYASTNLRNRTSEPEAGAVAWRIKNKNTGLLQLQAQPLADLPFNRERFDCEPLFTHPAPATADKLKVAVAALEPYERPSQKEEKCGLLEPGTRVRVTLEGVIAKNPRPDRPEIYPLSVEADGRGVANVFHANTVAAPTFKVEILA